MLIMGIFLPRVCYVWQWLESIGLRSSSQKSKEESRERERKVKAVKERRVYQSSASVAEAQSTFGLPYVHTRALFTRKERKKKLVG